MSSPYISLISGTSSKIKVNSISPNVIGNIQVPLSSLSDCAISTPTSAQVLLYNGGSWINANASTSNILPIPYLSTDNDVSLTNLSDKDFLAYNGSTAKWNNKTLLDVSNIPTLPQSKITNLTTDISSCEKTANKNISNGYCPLDSSSNIPISNIPQINHYRERKVYGWTLPHFLNNRY